MTNISDVLSGLQSNDGGSDAAPRSSGANTAVRSPADHRGSDIGFFCNNGGPSWLAQWVMEENTVHCMQGMPLLQGLNIIQVSGCCLFYFFFCIAVVTIFLKSKYPRFGILMAVQMYIGHQYLFHPD